LRPRHQQADAPHLLGLVSVRGPLAGQAVEEIGLGFQLALYTSGSSLRK
jgi:hypothetical protein